MDLQVKDKTALVTGSSAGIGFSIAKALTDEGANVIINGRSAKVLQQAVKALQSTAKGDVSSFEGDLSKSADSEKLLAAYPQVDILINNLGIFEPAAFEDITDQDWLRFFDVNVLSGVRLARAYLPAMKSQNWGRVLFISSESGVQIPEEMIHYGMTKAAQIAVARGLAESVAGTDITVNSVLPGPTRSRGVETFVKDMADQQGQSLDDFEKDFFENIRPTSLIKRFATTDEVAAMVCYLSSPLASATTGAAVRVEGGVIKSAF